MRRRWHAGNLSRRHAWPADGGDGTGHRAQCGDALSHPLARKHRLHPVACRTCSRSSTGMCRSCSRSRAPGGETARSKPISRSCSRSYKGPVGVMSFDPYSVAAFRDAAPSLPRGLVSERFERAFGRSLRSGSALACGICSQPPSRGPTSSPTMYGRCRRQRRSSRACSGCLCWPGRCEPRRSATARCAMPTP